MKKNFFVLFLIISFYTTALDIDSIFTRKKENFTNDWLGKQILSINIEGYHYGNYIFYNSTKNIIAVIDGYNIVIRNATSLEPIKTLFGDNGYVDSLAFSTDGKYLASGNRDKTVNIWDVETGNVVKTLIGHSSYTNYQAIKSVKFSPNNKYLISGSDDRTIRVWDVEKGILLRTLKGHNGSVSTLNFSTDGKLIISGSFDKTIKIWNFEDGKLLKTLFGSTSQVTSFDVDPKGKYIAMVDNGIKVWDINTGKLIRTIDDEPVTSVIYSSDGKYLISGEDYGANTEIKIREADSEKLLFSFDSPHVYSLINTSNNKALIIGTEYDGIQIWDLFYKSTIARTKINGLVTNDKNEVIAKLPVNSVTSINKEIGKIYIPLKGNININDFEELYINNDKSFIYMSKDVLVYNNPEKEKNIGKLKAGTILSLVFFSYDLNSVYIEEKGIKGWLDITDILFFDKVSQKIILLENKSSETGRAEIFEVTGENVGSYLVESIGIIPRENAVLLNEIKKNKTIFSIKKENNFYTSFKNGSSKPNSLGTEYIVLGELESKYYVQTKISKEKGWVEKQDVSFIKPDKYSPKIKIENTKINDDMIFVSGKIYDDTGINSFMLNGNKTSITKLKSEEKRQPDQENVYTFSSQWYLLPEVENTIELKAIDTVGNEKSIEIIINPSGKITINNKQ